MSFHSPACSHLMDSWNICDCVLGTKPQRTPDPVNNPSHYKSGGLEVIDVIEGFSLNYRLGNVLKYVLRHAKKKDPLEDLKKARWYLSREIERLEGR